MTQRRDREEGGRKEGKQRGVGRRGCESEQERRRREKENVAESGRDRLKWDKWQRKEKGDRNRV